MSSSLPRYDRTLVQASMLSRPFHENKGILRYREALREARWAARTVGMLHTISIFFNFCSLTWATVVLLGAFVSDLHIADYSFVAVLLLLEAARLATTTFFIQILTRSPEPGHLNQAAYISSADDDFTDPHHVRVLSPCFQALLIGPSFICAINRLLKTGSYSPHLVDHLLISLRIFYTLVIVGIVVSALNLFTSLLFIAWIHHEYPSELSVFRYYVEALSNVLASGVTQADNFNFFQYAFKMLGREHARCIGWDRVVLRYKLLLTYIYAHKQGADYLQISLDSEDASVRQAAANMVGMWADEKRGLGLRAEELDLPPELLMKLADMVGMGEVGWAATNSFGGLARRNPQYLVQTLTSKNERVLDRIAELVNESSIRTLACVRTLVLFYIAISMQLSAETQSTTGGRLLQETAGMGLPEAIEAELVRKLKHLLERSSVQRLRVHSAYLLYLLGKLDAPCFDLIRAIMPSSDTYWYEMEQKMLEFLRRHLVAADCAPPCYPSLIVPDLEAIYDGPSVILKKQN